MKLGTKGRYAVTAMLDIAIHSKQRPCPLCAVAERQGLPGNYLEQLFISLRQAGLLASTRGRNGGYYLLCPPDQITVADIFNAIGRQVEVTRCHGDGNCHAGQMCLTHHLWDFLGQRIRSLLDSITLADLMQRSEIIAVANRQTGHSDADVLLNIVPADSSVSSGAI